MKIEQVEINRSNIMDFVDDPTLYVVKMSNKGRTAHNKVSYPYGLSFKHWLSTYTIAEALDLIDGNGCVVRVTQDEK